MIHLKEGRQVINHQMTTNGDRSRKMMTISASQEVKMNGCVKQRWRERERERERERKLKRSKVNKTRR